MERQLVGHVAAAPEDQALHVELELERLEAAEPGARGLASGDWVLEQFLPDAEDPHSLTSPQVTTTQVSEAGGDLGMFLAQGPALDRQSPLEQRFSSIETSARDRTGSS